MRNLPKRYFQWKEPKSFLAAKRQRKISLRQWWHRPLIAFIVALVIVGIYVLNLRVNSKDAPTPILIVARILLAVFFSIFWVYFISWLAAREPSEVVMLKSRIRSRNRVIKYADIKSYAWHVCDDFATLTLKRKFDEDVQLGVPLDISRNDVTDFLDYQLAKRRGVADLSARTHCFFIPLGILLCVLGLLFTFSFIAIYHSKEQVIKDCKEIDIKLEAMKSELIPTDISDANIKVLLRMHKESLVKDIAIQHFIILFFFIFSSLLLSSVGLNILLWAKLRKAIYHINKELDTFEST